MTSHLPNKRNLKVLSVYSTKGGVGKTSLCANLGGIAADWGWKVLLIDTDPQPSLSHYFPITRISKFGITRIFSHAKLDDSISKTAIPGLDIVVSDDPENTFEQQLPGLLDGRYRLRYALDNLTGYDFVIVDTQGASGKILESAILACDILLSPIVPDILSAREFFRGTVGVWKKLSESSNTPYCPHSVNGVIYRTRPTVDSQMIVEQLRHLSESIPNVNLLSTPVPDRTVYRDAASAQIPVHWFERKRKNGCSARETMSALALEVCPALKPANL